MKKEVIIALLAALSAIATAQIALDDASDAVYTAGEEYIQVGTPPGNQTAATNGLNGGFGFNRWQRGGYGGAMPGYNHIKSLSPSDYFMGTQQFGLNATSEGFSGCDARRRLLSEMHGGETLSFAMMAGGAGAGNPVEQGYIGVEFRSTTLSNPGRDVFSIDNFGFGGDWEINHGGGTIHTGIALTPGQRLDVSVKALGGDDYEVTVTPFGGLPQTHTVSGYSDCWIIQTAQFYAFDTGTGDFYVNFLRLNAAVRPVSGLAGLQNFEGDVSRQCVTFEIREVGSTTPLKTHVAKLSSSGEYLFGSEVAAGNYDITAKGSHWLRQLISNVTISGSGAANVNFSLINGDCDDDNEVTLVDNGILATSFGLSNGETGYDARADLDGDNEVTLVDSGILSASFGQSGAE